MGYPWQKVNNAQVIADMAHPYPEGFRAPRWLATIEARAVVLLGVKASWPVRRLAERWGWGKTQAAQILTEAQAYLLSLDDADRTKPDNDRTKPDRTGQAKASESQQQEDRRTSADKTGQAPDTSRARVLSGEERESREDFPPSPEGDCPPSGRAADRRTPRELPLKGTSPLFPGAGRPKPERARSGANLTDFGGQKPSRPPPAEKPPPHVVMREGGYPVKEADGWYEVYFIGGKECRRYCREDGL